MALFGLLSRVIPVTAAIELADIFEAPEGEDHEIHSKGNRIIWSTVTVDVLICVRTI
jgi:hypothetical protein